MRTKLRFAPVMRWERAVEELIEAKLEGFSLNSPSGKSVLGSVRIDLDRSHKPDVVCDYFHLPFRDHAFDSAVSDPLWRAIDIFNRPRHFYELMRVVKAGGRIIYNASWQPKSRAADIEETYMRQTFDWSNSSLISIFRLCSLAAADSGETKE